MDVFYGRTDERIDGWMDDSVIHDNDNVIYIMAGKQQAIPWNSDELIKKRMAIQDSGTWLNYRPLSSLWTCITDWQSQLTHWGPHKMATILQITFSN